MYANKALAHGILRPAAYEQYTIVPQATIQNNKLSDAAYRILTHIGGMVDTWEISIKHLMNLFGWGYHKTRLALGELRDNGYLIWERVRGENGRYMGSVKILKMTPDCTGKVVGGEVRNRGTEIILTSLQSTSLQSTSLQKQTNITNTNSDLKLKTTNYPNSQVAVVNFSFSDPEASPSGWVVISDPPPSVDPEHKLATNTDLSYAPTNLEKINIPPVYDNMKDIHIETQIEPSPPPPTRTATPNPKSTLLAIGANIAHIKQQLQTARANATAAPETPKQQPQPKQQSKPRLSDPERLEYKTPLAQIGINIDDVKWIIATIDPQERQQAVSNAIAWVSENSWIKVPAAGFVEAIRDRRLPKQAAAQANREAMSPAQREKVEFNEWYPVVKKADLVKYSYADPNGEHYAIVVLADETAMGWREAQEYLANRINNG